MFPLIGIGFERIRRLTYAKPTHKRIRFMPNLTSIRAKPVENLGFYGFSRAIK